jgi:hypothetical protein
MGGRAEESRDVVMLWIRRALCGQLVVFLAPTKALVTNYTASFMQLSAFAVMSHYAMQPIAALLRRNCIIHRIGRHGLPNFSCYAKDVYPCTGIHWRRQHRQVRPYHAAGVEIILLGESDCETRGPLPVPGGVILQWPFSCRTITQCHHGRS